MCGICGIFRRDGAPVDRSLLERMNDTMVHRGPDGAGLYVDGAIGLGHRRLAIIDLHTGDQPMATEDGAVHVAFNGEIYNFQELRRLLEKAGYSFRTRSDTEVLLYAYREWGDNFVNHLRGMFAIALWDNSHQRLLLVRDRLGKKPLYYYSDGRRLVFGSELKALLADRSIPRDTDPEALDAYLSFGYVPSPLSIYRGINKLPPAHLLSCDRDKLSLRAYWDLDMSREPSGVNEQDALDELQEVFDESVRLRMISDVPLGAFLSGGVDSSAVVASMALQGNSQPVRTASIGFDEARYDELAYAGQVAQRYDTDHSEFVVRPNVNDLLENIARHFDEPFADSSAIPTWYVSQMARQQVTVALSGDGGDEAFAGYTQRYGMGRFEDNLRHRIPPLLRTSLIAPLSRIYPRLDNSPRPLRLKRFFENLSLPLEQAYFRDMSFYFRPDVKKRLYNTDFMKEVGDNQAFTHLRGHFAENDNPDPVTRLQYVDIKSYLADDILVKVDRMSMAHSLEVRSPILDHKVLECAAKMPSHLKLNGSTSKYIFKKMNEGRLPNDILHRRKQGFCVPLATWLRKDLKELAYDTIFSTENDAFQLFSPNYIHEIWNTHQNRYEDNSCQLWGLFMLGLWCKQHKQHETSRTSKGKY